MSRIRNNRKPAKSRCLVGLKFDLLEPINALKQELSELMGEDREELRLAGASNLNVTVKFVGNMLDEQMPPVDKLLKQIAARNEPMNLECRGLGFFKNSIWLGFKLEPKLLELAADVDRSFTEVGVYADERPYMAHVTIARFKHDMKPQFLALKEKYEDHLWGDMQASDMLLFKSETLDSGPVYSVLASYPLGQPIEAEIEIEIESESESEIESKGESEKPSEAAS